MLHTSNSRAIRGTMQGRIHKLFLTKDNRTTRQVFVKETLMDNILFHGLKYAVIFKLLIASISNIRNAQITTQGDSTYYSVMRVDS